MRDYREEFNQAGEEGLRGVRGKAGAAFLADYIARRMDLPDQGRVLDLGCGDGAVLMEIARMNPGLQCVGLDFAEAQIAKARAARDRPANTEFRVCDLKTGGFEGLGPFSRIYSFSVLQYFTLAEAAVLNLRLAGMVEPGGLIAHLSVPDLDKRVLLFQDDYLNQKRRHLLAALANLARMVLVDLKRRLCRDRRYGNSLFHDACEILATAPPGARARIIRPSDSWYRFDVVYEVTA